MEHVRKSEPLSSRDARAGHASSRAGHVLVARWLVGRKVASLARGNRKEPFRFSTFVTTVLLMAGIASGATTTWTGGGANDNWSTAGNWSAGPPVAGDDIIFAGSTRLTPNNDITPGTLFNSITFSGGSGPFVVGGNEVVLTGGATALASNVSSGTIVINNNITISASAATITANAGGQLILGGTLSGGSLSITASCSGNIEIIGVISGTGSFTKSGTGVLKLSGANTYSGATTVTAGALLLKNDQALGTTGSGTTVSAGATIDLHGVNYANAEPLTLNGLGPGNIGALTNDSSATATFAGLITLASASSIKGEVGSINLSHTGSITATYGLTLGGSIGGTLTSIFAGSTGGITKQDAGTWTLAGANTYTSTTTISAGILRLAHTSALGTTGAGTTVASGAALDLNGVNYSAPEPLTLSGTGIASGGALINSSGTGATFGGAITMVAATAITGGTGGIVIPTGISGSFGLTLGGAVGGSISGAITTGSGTLTKANAGNWTLSGVNTYTGTTTVSAGILTLGSSTALGTTASGTTVSSGAVLDLNGQTYASAEALTLNGTGIASGGALTNGVATTATFGGLITLGSNVSIIAATGNITISNAGTITGAGFSLSLGGASAGTLTSILGTGAGTLIKQNAGTWTISGANTYTGATTVSAGTLRMGSATSISNTSAVTVNGILDLNGYSETIGSLAGNGAVDITAGAGTNTLTCGGDNTSTTFSGVIMNSSSQTLALTKSGTGILTLSGANTYNGLTSVLAGTLKLSHSLALGTTTGATSVSNGAGLDLNGQNIGAEALTLFGVGIASGGALSNGNAGAASLSGALTLSGASSIVGETGMVILTNTGNLGGSGYSLTLGGAAGGSIACVLATSGGTLNKLGTGTWTLNGSSSRTGNTNIMDGVLAITTPTALGSGDVTVDAATLDLRINGAGNNGAIPLGNTFHTSTGSTATLNVANNGSNTGNTVEIGTYTIGNATLDVTGNNGYKLKIGTLILDGGPAGTATLNPTTANLLLDYASTSSANPHTLDFGGTSTGNEFVNQMTDGSATLSLTKSNSSTWILGGSNTYTGATSIDDGTLKISNFSSLGSTTSGTTVASGAVLDLFGNFSDVEPLTLNGTGISNSGALVNSDAVAATFSGPITLASATSIIGETGSIDLTHTGAIAGGSGLTLGGSAGGQLFGTLSSGNLTKTGSGTWALAGSTSLSLSSLTLSSGTLHLGSGLAHSVTSSLNLSGGTLHFGSSSLTVAGSSADFSALASVTAGSGTLIFNSASAQAFIPKSGVVFPAISKSNAGALTLSGGAVNMTSLSVSGGTWNWGSSTNTHTVGSITTSGSSAMSVGTNTIRISGNCNFSGLATLSYSTGTLEFIGSSGQSFWANTSNIPNLTKTGTGTTTLTSILTTPSLVISAGAWNMDGYTLQTTGDLTMSAGTLDNTGNFFINGNLSITGGTWSTSAGSIQLFGNVAIAAGTLNFSGNLPLSLVGTASGKQLNIVPSIYGLTVNGPAGVWTATGPLTVSNGLTVSQGTLSLGTGLNHAVGSISTVGGNLDLLNSDLSVTTGNAVLDGLASLTTGSGTLRFTAGSGTQTLTPFGGTNPILSHTGAGTLMFSGATVTCRGLIQSAGTLSFNGSDLSINNVGNFTLTNGTPTSIQGLTGRTITVTGNTTLSGASAASKLNLNPGSIWWLAASGSASVTFATMANGIASATPGTCSSCIEGGGNSSWSFPVVWDGGGSGNNWTTADNWSSDAVPTSEQEVLFNATSAKSVTLDANRTVRTIAVVSAYTGDFNFGSQILSVSKDADFNTGGTITAASGTLEFIGVNPQLFYPKASATFPTISQNGAGGTTVSGAALWTNGLNIVSGTFHFSTGTHQIGSLATTGGGLDLASADLQVTAGNADFSGLSTLTLISNILSFTAASGTQTLTPHASLGLPAIYKSGAGTATVATNPLNSGGLTVSAGTWHWGGSSLTHNVYSLNATGGTMTFGSNTVKAMNTVDLGSLGTLNANSGSLEFINTSAQSFIPKAGATHPAIRQNGVGGTTTISTNALIAGDLLLSQGTLHLGSSMAHSVGSISGTANLNFGTSNLNATGNVDLSGITVTAASANTLAFTGASPQTFTPNASLATLNLTQNGTGGTTISGYNFNTPTLTLSAGNMNLGSGRAHSINTALAITGGGLQFGSATTLLLPMATVDLSALASLNPGTGASGLVFVGGSAQTYIPYPSGPNPNIIQNGSGGTTLSGNLTADALHIYSGTLDLGTGRDHSFASLIGSGGGLVFNNSIMRITSGNADLSGFSPLTPGTGTLSFEAASGTQTLTPKNSANNPRILHPGAGTLTLAAYNLTTTGFIQTAGTLDFNGRDITTTSSGEFTVTGGTAAFANGSGRIVTVSGNAGLTGTSAAALINVDNLTLNVAGTLSGTFANLNGSTATGTQGACSNCVNTASTNWVNAISWTGATSATWSTGSNWGNAAVPGSADNLLFNATANNCELDANRTVNNITFTSGYTGTFSFTNRILSITGNSDFRSGGAIAAGTGTLAFTGSSAQTFIPKSGTLFPAIHQNGNTGTTTITTHALTSGNVTLGLGTLHLGASMTHSVGSVSGTGALHFGTSNLNATGDVNLGSASVTATVASTLAFTSASAQIYTPNASEPDLNLTQNGAGGTTIATNNFTTPNLTIASGTLNLGTGLSHAVTSAVNFSAGGLNFNSSTLNVAAASVDFNSLASLTAGTGTLLFSSASAQTFTPKNGTLHPDILQSGAGGTTLANQGLIAGNLIISNGTFSLGSTFHQVTGIITTSGGLDFGTGGLNSSGNTDLSALASLTPGTGSLTFNKTSGTQTFIPKNGTTHPTLIHSGAGTLQLSTYDLTCLWFSNAAGILDFNGRNISTVSGGNFAVSAGTNATLVGLAGRTLTVAGNASFTGTSGANRLNLDPGSAWTLAVTGTLTANFASLGNNAASVSSGACSNCANMGANSNWSFSVGWDGGGADNNWTTAGNWGSDFVPTSADAVIFGATSVKDATLDAAATVNSITFVSGYTGNFSFSSNILSLAGNGDFRSGGTFTAGTGTLMFTGSSAQIFIPKSGATFPAISQTGSGGTTLLTHALTAGNLNLSSGTFNLGAGFTHTVASISGTGGLDFGTSNLNTTGDVNLAAATVTAASSNTLFFKGASAQTFSPKSSLTTLNLTQDGTGGTTVASYVFTTPVLTLANGTLSLGTSGGNNTVTSALTITGGGLNFSSHNLYVQAATVDLSALATIVPGTGRLNFTSSSAQTFIPKAGATHPIIQHTGTGTTTLVTNSLTALGIYVSAGNFILGTSLNHSASEVIFNGGNFDFGSSILHVTSGNGAFGVGYPVSASAGAALDFNASSGTQIFTPTVGGTSMPTITHSGASTLQLSTNPLSAKGFSQSAGVLDLNGQNISIDNGGNFTVSNGTPSSFTGLAGRTLTVAGNTSLTGSSTGSLINLNPGAAWTLASTGTLTANLASLNYSNASVSTGACLNCSDGGNNANWSSAITWDGGGADNNWSTVGNWGLDAVPTATDNIVFDASSVKDVSLNSIGNVGSIKFTSAYTGTFAFGTQSLNVYGASADLRTGGSFAPGSGLVYFLGSGAQTLIPPASGTLPNLQRTSTGILTISTNPYVGYDVLIPNGTINLGSGLTHTIHSLGGNSSGTLDFGTSHVNVTSGGSLDFSNVNAVAGGSNTVSFTGSSAMIYVPRAGLTTLGISQTGTGTTTVLINDFAAPSLAISAGTFQLGTGRSHTLSSFTGTGGTLDFGSSSLTVSGTTVDFSGLAAVTPGTGSLLLSSASAQSLIPKSGATLPAIIKNGAGTATLATFALSSGALTLNAGALNLGSGLTHTVGAISGSGALDFGSSNLNATGNVDFSGLTVTASSSNTMAFTGAAAKTYTPKASVTGLNLSQAGPGTTTITTNDFTTPTLSISVGSMNLGTSRTHTVSSALSIGGGEINFSSSTLRVAASTINLNSLSSLVATSGLLEFTGASAQTFTPKAAVAHPRITQSGAGGTTIATNSLIADVLTLTSGTLALGTGLSHQVSALATTSGTLNFGTSTLSISGDANFSGLTTLTPGTGVLEMNASSGTQILTPKLSVAHPAITHNSSGTLQLASNDLNCAAYSQNAGRLDFNGRNVSTTGNFTVTNGTTSTFTGLSGRTLTVGGAAVFTGTSSANRINLNPGAAWGLAVTGALTGTLASIDFNTASVTAGTCSNCANAGSNSNWNFDVSWSGAGGNGNWTTAGNWGSGSVPTSLDVVSFNATSVNATLDAAASVKSITFTSGYTGTFDFSSNTLTINSGSADFRSGGTLSTGSGALAFTSGTAQTFIPKSGTSFPVIAQSGAGGTTVSVNALTGGTLTLTNGTFNLGTGFTHTLVAVSGSGGLDFGSSNLNATGNVDLSGLTVTASTASTLAFTGASAQTFTPNASVTLLKLAQNGTGGTTVAGYNFTTPELTQATGTLNLGTSRTHTVSTTLTLTGGGLDFASSTLRVAAANVDLTPLSALTAGTGTLEFTGGSAQTFTPKASTAHPNISQSGAGGTTVTANLNAGMLSIGSGAGFFILGGGSIHTVTSIAAAGGALKFTTTPRQLVVTTGNADLQNLAAIQDPQFGTLVFSANSGTQILSPKSGATNPIISHTGAGTLQLASSDLLCPAFSNTSGPFDLNGRNVSTTNGDFAITNGSSSTLAGLSGRTITVAGNASFNGAASTNRLNLNPGAAWTLNVGGTLTSTMATLDYSNATGSVSTGICTDCANAGNNSNWNFNVSWDGGGGNSNWTTAANWGSDAVPSTLDAVTFNATSADATLDASASVKSITFTGGYTGTFNFSTNTLSVSGDADFRGGENLTAGSGTLAFTGTSPQLFYPKSGAVFPNLNQNGTGGTTHAGSGTLTAGNLTLSAGTFNLASGFTEQVASVSGNGGLDFNGSNLNASGNVNLSGLTVTAASANILSFNGSGSQTFTPNASVTGLHISKSGTGSTTVAGNNFTTPSLSVSNGSLNLGIGLQHASVGFSATGGVLAFGSATLALSGSSLDMSGLTTITAGTGLLRFTGTSAQNFKPHATEVLPNIAQSGTGGTTVVVNGLKAGNLAPLAGTFNLGTGLVHNVASVSMGGGPYGSLNFGSSQLRVSGLMDIGTLVTLTPGTGSLHFDAPSGTQDFTPKSGGAMHPPVFHAGAGTLRLTTNNLTCASFTQTAGTLDFNSRDLTSVGAISVTNGNAASVVNLAGRTLTIAGNAILNGTSSASKIGLNPASPWILNVGGTLSGSFANLAFSTASGSFGTCVDCVDGGSNSNWTFAVGWDGGGADNNWTTALNWGSDAVPGTSDAVSFNSTSKSAFLDADAVIKSISFGGGYTGGFDFGTRTLTLNGGNADFQSGGAILPGTGTLAFTATATQTFTPQSGVVYSNVLINKSGAVNLASALAGGNLTVTAGTLNLGSALSHNAKNVSGNGTLDFGSSHLAASGNVDLSGLTLASAGGNILSFIGSSPQTYTPKASFSGVHLTQNGAGGTTLLANGVTTSSLTLAAGTLNLGSGLTHAVTGSFATTGGGLDFGSSSLNVAASALDLSTLSQVLPGTGTLSFTGASAQTFKPKVSTTHPHIVQNGAGGATVIGNALAAGSLTLAAGTFALGAGLNHTFASVTSTGGGLDFGSSTLNVTTGGANLSGLATLTAASGKLLFTAATGTQAFSPKGGANHPAIEHNGAGLLSLNAADLLCASFRNQSGAVDLNGRNISVAGFGFFDILNGTSTTVTNLSGRTITVGGNATLLGLPANHLNLNPVASWTLAVSGTLKAVNADIRNSLASVAAGSADSSLNLGGNSNWSFVDSIKPDNVTGFLARAVTGHAVELTWSAPTASDADSVMLRYRTDGLFPVSRTDGSLWRNVSKVKTNDTATGLPDKAVYHFAAFVKDSSGNFSPGNGVHADSAFTPDVTPPGNVSALSANAFSPTAAALAWSASASSDADTVVIRYRTNGAFPADANDGTLWKKVSAARIKDTATGLIGNTVYHFGLFVRDSSGNYSAAATPAQDTALYQAPVTGSLAIADNQGRTRDPDPALAFAYTGADSMRFSPLADTGAAAWSRLRASDSLTLASGADGNRIVLAQFKNIFGLRSPWYRDTTVLDRAAPVVSMTLNASHSWRNWPDAVAGRAMDATVGTDSVFLIRRRVSDGAYFNGAGWTTVADTAKLRVDSTFSVPMPNAALITGDYAFTAYARDKVGNISVPSSMTVRFIGNRDPVTVSSNLMDSVLQNQQVAWKLDLGDLDAGDSVLTVTTSIPPWLTLTEKADSAQGGYEAHRIYTLTGKPLQADVGNATFTVQARDLGGKTLTYSKTLTVLNVNDAPVFSAGQDSTAAKEDSVSRFIPAYTDADVKDPHTLALLQAPAWVQIADSALVFKPGSRDAGPSLVRLTVSDGALLDTLDLVVRVANVNDAPVAFPSGNWQAQAHWKEDVTDTFTVVVVDMDKGDPISLATTLPKWMSFSSSTDAFEGYNRFFKFTVNPKQADTGGVSLKLRFQDGAGAFSELPLTAKVAAVNDAPTATVSGQQVQAGAARIALDVIDQDGNAASTRFHYRLIAASGDTVRRGISASAVLALHPLADGDYKLAIAAEDEGGLRQSGHTLTNLRIAGATTLTLDSARWNMIGYPGRSLSAGALGSGAALTSWDESAGDGSPLGRYATGKSADSLARGKGYWVRVPGAVNLSAPLAELLEKPYTMKLTHGKQGWNQVGNPFPYFVDLSSTGLQFWEWDANRRDLVNTKGILKPWGAYWVQVAKDTSLTLKDEPYFSTASGPLAKSSAVPDNGTAAHSVAPAHRRPSDWTLQLALQAGPYQDASNFMGIRKVTVPGATASGNQASGSPAAPGLMPDAPKFGDYIALHFEKPGTAPSLGMPARGSAGNGDSGLGYAEDFRDRLEADEAWWDFSIENSASGLTSAALSLPGLDTVLNSGLYVFLVKRGEAMPLSAGKPIVLGMDGAVTHYALVVSPHADFAARLKGDFSVAQNFPNPIASSTTFRFFLPQAWGADGKREAKAYRLRLNVYDFSGRLAARVADGSFQPGAHSLIWRSQSLGGGALAKGAYVYRLEIPGMAKTMKMIVK